MTNTLTTSELLDTISDADVYVIVDGTLGYITTATRIRDTWSFFVTSDSTSTPLGSIDLALDGSVEVVRIDR